MAEMTAAFIAFKRDANKARYSMQHEEWFRSAMLKVLLVAFNHDPRFDGVAPHVKSHLANKVLSAPDNKKERDMREEAREIVEEIVTDLRKSGIIPVPF